MASTVAGTGSNGEAGSAKVRCDGKISLLRDSNADRLEDDARIFWQNEDLKVITGIALTLAGDAMRGSGRLRRYVRQGISDPGRESR